jgi:membrane protein implicated in regulation of membrane protease activity
VFLLAWLTLIAAVASLYAGLSAEGLGFFYLAIVTSAITVILVVVQLRRGAPSPRRPRATPPPEG